MKEKEKKSGSSSIPQGSFDSTQYQGNSGFQAKANSTAGAERQRSIGNRNNKRAR